MWSGRRFANGSSGWAAQINKRLVDLEQRQVVIDVNLAEVYRQKVATLADALDADDGAAAREIVHGLVDAIVLVPEARPLAG